MQKQIAAGEEGCTFSKCLGGFLSTIIGLSFAVMFTFGMFWRFGEYGRKCSEDILEEQGLAMKIYYVFFLCCVIPCCCPCGIALLICC